MGQVLNETQLHLIKEICEDRIAPALSKMLKTAEGDKDTLLYIVDIIELALASTLSKKDADFLISAISPPSVQLLLTSLVNLFLPENNQHIFISPILNSPYTIKENLSEYKKVALEIYSQTISNTLAPFKIAALAQEESTSIEPKELHSTDEPRKTRSLTI